MSRVLLLAALLASACDYDSGGSPPAERPDRDGDGWLDAGDCAPDDPGAYREGKAFVDADRDTHGVPSEQTVCLGQALPAGYAVTDDDCDDGDARAWQELVYMFRDADGDGFGLTSPGAVCAGENLPAGYLLEAPYDDCDDEDASVWASITASVDVDGDGVGVGEPIAMCSAWEPPAGYAFATGDCAPEDATAYQEFAYQFRDADGDGHTVAETGAVCMGSLFPPGYDSVAGPPDCDDGDPLLHDLWTGFPDGDGDGVGAGPSSTVCAGDSRPGGQSASDSDCAATDATRWQVLEYAYRDADGDTFTHLAPGTVCSGVSLPPGHTDVPKGADCADDDPTIFVQLVVFADLDGDGVGAGASSKVCTNGSLPVGTVKSGSDCAASNASAWQLLVGFPDVDGDGFTLAAVSVCSGATLPAPYLAAAKGNDCDDGKADVFRWMALYPDGDGDGVGAPPREIVCIGTALPGGLVIRGDDPDDGDPGQMEADDDLELIL